MRLNLNVDARSIIDTITTPEIRVHFSQLGEDCIVWHSFEGHKNGFYVDAGCHDPYRYSNTYLLHKFNGWRGINIDADSRAIERFKQARPSDINICCGVGLREETRELKIYGDGAVNTFDAELASRHKTFGEPISVPVQIKRLETILNEHMPIGASIDYLNIDCEGLDHDVVTSNCWAKYRPRIVTVEIHSMNLYKATENPTVQYMRDQGYVFRAHYFATSFFEYFSRS